jgi:maltose alpha-D-glucosyltransferase/alpha-amylase
VVKAVTKVMRFWLDLGVDGVRLDAIPYLCVREGTYNENLPETHAVIKQMRAVVDRRITAAACSWPRPISGRRTCASTSATATSATWPTTSP